MSQGNSAEGGASATGTTGLGGGITVSATNSGGLSGDAFAATDITGSGIFEFSNAWSAHGGWALRYAVHDTVTASDCRLRHTNAQGAQTWHGRFYFMFDSQIASGHSPGLIRYFNNATTGTMSYIYLVPGTGGTGGALQIRTGANTTVANSNGTYQLQPTVSYRLEWTVTTDGANPSNITVAYSLYSGDGTSALESRSLSGADGIVATAQFASWDSILYGVASVTQCPNTTGYVYLDDMVAFTAARPGPYSAASRPVPFSARPGGGWRAAVTSWMAVSSGGGSISTLPAAHTNISSWVKIDTTSLWQANGGQAPPGTTMTINGQQANTAYGLPQPTPATPIVTWLMPVGTQTIALGGYYQSTIDVWWRGYPWKATQDTFGSAPNWTVSTTQNSQLVTGTSFPASLAGVKVAIAGIPGTFTVATVQSTTQVTLTTPVPAGYTLNSVTMTANLNTTYFNGPLATYQTVPSAANGWQDGTPYQQISALNNGYSFVPDPAPATSAVFCVAPGDEGYQPTISTNKDTLSELSVGDGYATGPGAIPGAPTGGIDAIGNTSLTVRYWRDDFQLPSTWTAPVTVENTTFNGWAGSGSFPNWPYGTNTASTIVTNNGAAVGTLSNLLENQATTVLGWASGGASGTNGQIFFRYQPTSLGIGIKQLTFDVISVAWDTRYPTIVEYAPHVCALTNGVPWIVAAGTAGPGGTAWSTTNSVAPYGVPPTQPFGGGWFRTWRLVNAVWTCTSANLKDSLGAALSVPGVPTIANGAIVGDSAYPQYGTDCGKVFGPTLKCNGAALASGPSGSTGTVLLASAAAPFNITVNKGVAAAAFHGAGGWLFVGSELMYFSSWTATSTTAGSVAGTFHVTGRAQQGTVAADHALGVQVAGMIDVNVCTPGVNQSQSLATPFCARHWPLLIAPTWNTAAVPIEGVP